MNVRWGDSVSECIMKWVEGWDREQAHLLPERIEDYVGADNPVRFLDAFVEAMDLRAAGFGFPKEDARGRGRPAYRPADLLKLYLYGYLYPVRSSRRLEAECRRNLEVIWLLRRLEPDFKTIADFRRDNAGAFKAMVRQFTRLCHELELFGGELIAIDGTKIKGQNAPGKNFSRGKLEKHLQALAERLEEYLAALDQADQQPGLATVKPAELKEKIERVRQHQSRTQERLKTLKQSGQGQLSETDPDSRGMKQGKRHVVGYNVQGAVDAKHHLLVAVEATNIGVDQGQLTAIAAVTKAELKLEGADLVADAAYYKGEDINACQRLGFEVHLPTPNQSPSERAGLYGKAAFQYDSQQDVYLCPAGAQLKRRRSMTLEQKGKVVANYENPRACANCQLKARCTKVEHRTVSRSDHEEAMQRMAQAVVAAPQKLAARKTLIEHCWGTIKWLLPGGFLVRGLKRVTAETSLAHWAYNFKRALAVAGLKKLLTAV
jgi:transposase